MSDRARSLLRLALPSKGELEAPTLAFLASCGLEVFRPNERQYLASIPSVPSVVVLFQRAADILAKVDEGTVDLGITGYDIVRERGDGHDNVVIAYENLGYGGCELVLAIPESWLDVSTIGDLAELTVLYKEKGRELRIATKYPNLTRKWLYEKGIVHFSLVEAQGALEAAPNMGYADLIADLTTSGTTLRENRLKRIQAGTILESQACLVGNKRLLGGDEGKLNSVRLILELIEGRLRAKKFVSITANIQGASPEAVSRSLMAERALVGLRGPSLARVYSKVWGEDDWYAVTVVVEKGVLLQVVDHLRRSGGTDITISAPDYVFQERSWHFEGFVERLKRDRL